MKPARFTWVIVGAVVALVVFAVVDALRSPNKAVSASTTTGSTTTVEQASGRPSSCTRRQIAVSAEVREHNAERQNGRAAIIVGRIGANPCNLDGALAWVTMKDRRGQTVGGWSGRFWLRSESLAATVPVEFPCEGRGPFLALVRVVGLYPDPSAKPFRIELRC